MAGEKGGLLEGDIQLLLGVNLQKAKKLEIIKNKCVYIKKKEEIMSRSIWKGPFVDITLIKKAEKVSESGRKEVIKTWSRRSTIIPQFVGLTFGVYNGHKFIPVSVTENMVGHKLGEFSPTRIFKGHTTADKKVVAKVT